MSDPGRVALVTDSTASLPERMLTERSIRVVPLQVVIGQDVFDEALRDGVPEDGSQGATPSLIAEKLTSGARVTTSRPAPTRFAELYAHLAAEGYQAVVSVHLSAHISGTVESARLAARDAPIPVTVVDSTQVGAGTGYAAVAASDVLSTGGSAEEAAALARAVGEQTRSLFYVDTLEYLRRGGRVGRVGAVIGGALAVKPLLHLDQGKVESLGRVRTAGKALRHLADLAVEAAADDPVSVTVAHLANPARAEGLAADLRGRLADQLEGREVICAQVGAVLGAHVGPGMVAVALTPHRID